jgi:hypothetical protein
VGPILAASVDDVVAGRDAPVADRPDETQGPRPAGGRAVVPMRDRRLRRPRVQARHGIGGMHAAIDGIDQEKRPLPKERPEV